MPLDVQPTTEFVLELPNKPGTLGELAQLLGKEQINILGFAAVATDGTGTVHLITDDPHQAEETLEASGYVMQTRQALLVTLANQPGELGYIANKLGTKGINIEASFVTTSDDGETLRCAVSVDDAETALQTLENLD